jgi:ribosome recycling factor
MNLAILDQKQNEFNKITEHLKSEFASLRTGRANASLVENLSVDYYGSQTPLIQIAQITIPEPRSIAIQPYDKSALKDIEKAVLTSSLGITPINDGTYVRVNIQPMTEERRKDMVKVVGQMTEKARVSIRNLREDIWKEIQRMEESGEISEDDKIAGKGELQKVVDKYNEEIKQIAEAKEKEVMTI